VKIRAIIKIDDSSFDFSTRFSQVSLRQSVGGHHTCDISVDLNLAQGALNARAAEWIGKKLSIGIGKVADENYDEEPILVQTFTGFVTSVSMQRHAGSNQIIISGKSPTIGLDSGPHMKIFTQKTLEEIVTDVIKTGSYQSLFGNKTIKIEPKNVKEGKDEGTLPYIVQYKESDWNFLGRLAARYGKWLYYDGQTLHFIDQPEVSTAIDLSYASDLIHLSCAVKAVPKDFTFSAYDYRENKDLETAADYEDNPGASELADTIMETASKSIFPTKPALFIHQTITQAELDLMIDRREQAHINDMIHLTGSCRNPALRIGGMVKIDDKDWFEEDYGTYQITSITHEISHGGNYTNHFEALPQQVRVPILTHSTDPPFCEDQVAEVIKIDDDKKLGRVKVRFRWQKGENPAVSESDLPWLRVASPYTGTNKGIYFLPEIGDQVLVSFEQQHPEKPFVLSGFYHNDAKPEHHHAQNDFKGIKTRGQNSILFNDKSKSESIEIRSPKNIGIHAGEKVQITAGKAIHISTEKNGQIIINAGDGGEIIIVGKKIVIKGQQNEHIVLQNNSAVVNGGDTAAIVAEKTGIKGNEVAIQGSTVGITGASGVNISGSSVKLNS
jgi:type VI secretion system secreted protein VgrG